MRNTEMIRKYHVWMGRVSILSLDSDLVTDEEEYNTASRLRLLFEPQTYLLLF